MEGVYIYTVKWRVNYGNNLVVVDIIKILHLIWLSESSGDY